jgi:hypothetical protein
MSNSHFNDEDLVLFGPIISKFFAFSYEEKNKKQKQRVRALVLSLCMTLSELSHLRFSTLISGHMSSYLYSFLSMILIKFNRGQLRKG